MPILDHKAGSSALNYVNSATAQLMDANTRRSQQFNNSLMQFADLLYKHEQFKQDTNTRKLTDETAKLRNDALKKEYNYIDAQNSADLEYKKANTQALNARTKGQEATNKTIEPLAKAEAASLYSRANLANSSAKAQNLENLETQKFISWRDANFGRAKEPETESKINFYQFSHTKGE